jgi:3-phosphoshikimate 1-carboxyvinyltransferase
MFTPIAALSSKAITIQGEGSLLKRPMGLFDEVLPQLDVQIQSNNGYLPLQLKGPLKPKSVSIDGSLSSQFLTGLLMAFAGAKANKVTISVRNLNSKPYIQLTLQIMQHFGLCTPLNKQFEHFYFENNSAQIASSSCSYYIEGDWSGAAFLLVAGAIAGPVTVKGLQFDSVQADKAILQALQQAGCSIKQEKDAFTVEPSALVAFQLNATDCPDLFPPLAVLAAYCKGTSVIEGVHRLMHKESNRAEALQQELGKMGVQVEIENNNMKIQGGHVLKGAHLFSHNDHRIAMAGAVAALKAKGTTVIEHADAVKKSYPSFYTHLQQLGALVEIVEENNHAPGK